MTPKDKGCTSWKQMQEQMVEDLLKAADGDIAKKEPIQEKH
jgi:hypothetical protein